MNLEKSLRAFVSPAYDPTEIVAATDEEAVDLAHLNTDLRPGREVVPLFDEEYWPNSLTLRARLLPIPFQEEQRQTQAVFISNEISFQSTLFYGLTHQEGPLRHSCYAGVDVIYEGSGMVYQEGTPQPFTGWQVGDFQLKGLLEKQGVLYHKAFPVQHVSLLMCAQRHLGAGKWLITTHLKKKQGANEVPIFSYGGIYQHHLPLDHVIPLYATLAGANEQKTRVTLKSQKFWYDKGMKETQPVMLGDTTYAFHDLVNPEEIMSLGAAIAVGRVRVGLEIKGESKIYHSRRAQRMSQNDGLVEITFVATE
jgi:hypothetical protein